MEITPNGLAAIVGGRVEGDGEVRLTGFAKIEEAGPGDLSFIANPKYAHFLTTTRASALLVGDDFDAGTFPQALHEVRSVNMGDARQCNFLHRIFSR